MEFCLGPFMSVSGTEGERSPFSRLDEVENMAGLTATWLCLHVKGKVWD